MQHKNIHQQNPNLHKQWNDAKHFIVDIGKWKTRWHILKAPTESTFVCRESAVILNQSCSLPLNYGYSNEVVSKFEPKSINRIRRKY